MRPRPTLADYAVIAISPALIMLMVGSLVFFLIQVFYQGQYGGRLCFIMGLFVMGAVLIGRISIEEGREYAGIFAACSGIATALATLKFVQFQGPLSGISPLITLGLVALVWWSADKLTWDCTVIDEKQDASGEGLLHTAGMEGGTQQGEAREVDVPPDGTTSREPVAAQTLWQKFVAYRRRPHAPGVWVLYFSLAALPIFGFGQWFASQELASRRYVFQLLVVYLAAGLGLLVTTSFLGLRRYLRQRRLEMPLEMASSWLGVGAMLIVAVLLFCMLLPRRNPEYSITHLAAFAGSRDLSPSNMGWGSDGPEDQDAANQTANRPQGESESDQQGENQQTSDRGDSESQDQSQGQSQPGRKQENGGRSQDDAEQGEGDRNAQQRDSKQQGRSEKREDSQQEPDGDSEDRQQQQQGDEESQQAGEQDRAGERSDGSRSEDRGQQRSSGSKRADRPRSRRPLNASRVLNNLGRGFGGLLKLIYWSAAIILVAYLAWRYWPQIVRAVRDFVNAWREFWARLLGRKRTPVETVEEPQASTGPGHRGFADFPDPFLSGMAERYSAQQLIKYSFEAFEAWARERGCPRDPEQTPHEFAHAVARREKSLIKAAPRLAELYSWSAYGRDKLPKSSLEHLRRFWRQLAG